VLCIEPAALPCLAPFGLPALASARFACYKPGVLDGWRWYGLAALAARCSNVTLPPLAIEGELLTAQTAYIGLLASVE